MKIRGNNMILDIQGHSNIFEFNRLYQEIGENPFFFMTTVCGPKIDRFFPGKTCQFWVHIL